MQDTLDDIARALTTTGRILDGITAAHWSDPTPCEAWDVRAEVNHLVGGLRLYAAELTGREPAGAHEDDWLGHDPTGAYREAALEVLAAWRSPGAEQRMIALSFGTVPAPMAAVVQLTEVVVHGLDVAIATGQDDEADQEQSERLLQTMHRMGMDSFRAPGIFAAEEPVDPDAPAHLRLLAFLGRQPSAVRDRLAPTG